MPNWSNLFSQAGEAIKEGRKLVETLEEMDQEQRDKEKKTAEVLKQIESQGATEQSIQELLQDEKNILGEESELLNVLDQANEDERNAERVIDEVIDAINGKENNLDAEISEIRNDLDKIEQDGLVQSTAKKAISDITNTAKELLEDSKALLQAAKEEGLLEQEEFMTLKVEKDDEEELEYLENLTREAGNFLTKIGDQHDEKLEESAFQTEEKDEEQLSQEEALTQENISHLNEQINEIWQLAERSREEFNQLVDEVQEFGELLNQQNSELSRTVESQLEQVIEILNEVEENLNQVETTLEQVKSQAEQNISQITG